MHTQVSWILASISLALLAGAGLLWLLHGRSPRKRPLPTEWTVTARPVFSTEERRVYRQLREALPHHICCRSFRWCGSASLPIRKRCAIGINCWAPCTWPSRSAAPTGGCWRPLTWTVAAVPRGVHSKSSNRCWRLVGCATCAVRQTRCRRFPNCNCWCPTLAPQPAGRNPPPRRAGLPAVPGPAGGAVPHCGKTRASCRTPSSATCKVMAAHPPAVLAHCARPGACATQRRRPTKWAA